MIDDGTPGSQPGPLYREYAPAPDLAAYVACTWVRIVGPGDGGAEAPSPVIPDGCADIVAHGGGAPHVAGPATATQWVGPDPATVITGVRFRPGAARAVLRFPAHELRDRNEGLLDVCGRRARPLLGDVAAAPDAAARRAAMERWVRARLAEGGGRRTDDLAVIRAARLLTDGPVSTVDALAGRLGWGTRRLHREFTAACGYGPKTLQRVMRLQRAVGLARAATTVGAAAAGAPIRLSELAAAAGYADQAHMTRDFRSLTGFTPAAYLASAHIEVGRWLELSA